MPRSPQGRRRLRRLAIALIAAVVVVLPAAVALAATDPATQDTAAGVASVPDTRIDSGPSITTSDANPVFAFSSPQDASDFACSLDAAPFAPCTSPQTLSSLTEGTHTFRVRALDSSGIADATPASRTFAVDTAAPEVAIQSGPAGPVNDALPAFTFASQDPRATLSCSLAPLSPAFAPCPDEGAYQPSAPLPDGSYSFAVRATDPAGNSATATRDFSVDTAAPPVAVDSGPAGSTEDASPAFTFSSPDVSATFSCSLDTGDPSFGPCSGEGSDEPKAELEAGSYTFRVRATDPAGNSTAATREFEVKAADSAARTKQSIKSSAPKPVPAWYMTARGVRDLRRQARNDACAFARRQSNNTRVLLLDFGKPEKHRGEFGARLRLGHHFSNQDILSALQAAADRYRSNAKCYSRGSVRITYGNTNNMAHWLSRPKVRKSGRRQAMMANRLHKYQRLHGRRYRHEGVSVAGDIEPQWNKPRVTKALVHGATAHKRGGLYFNYGAASQCPPETSRCANNWSLKNLGQVSYGGIKRSMPEIYRGVHVKQWTNVRRRWNNQHHHHYCFYGATSTPGFPLKGGEGWSRLAADNRCVQGELVNIREQ